MVQMCDKPANSGSLRVYGHEFLAQRCLVQLSLGHPFSRTSSKPPPVKLYSRSGQDSLHLWSSLKLVMTSKLDITAVPHSVILPLADEREVFSFQVQSLERFTLELSLYPTFGSKVIGRAVILPATFLDIRYHKSLVAPLLDHQLKTIGEVAFEVSCIKPFEGAQLEIGGRVETYWKSKVTPSAPTQDHAHPFQTHRPLSVSTSSPALRPPAIPPSSQPRESALVTASSLSGDYVHVVVQVTKDGHPVVYPDWHLPIPGFEIGVTGVTLAQFQALAASTSRPLVTPETSSPSEWSPVISNSLVSLEELLAVLPSDIGINLQLRYARSFDAQALSVGRSGEINEFVDSVLHVIYEAGKATQGRKVIFSSFDPTVCTALNWKQPNCKSADSSASTC
ncbi:hypothetical protein BCR39DRAFT_144265 [Naematelia encephala]|uniref:GP-PDE domain-containing protein n=1 Tax=Naematelia encephala TaxID=71784 RepID=A0A1Y2BJT0_9TREE|nr:hypothetical protein BCR39DRAFT_144265 [Naematelia encephala]